MKLKTLAALIVTTYIGFNFVAQSSATQPVFTPEQEARIGKIAAGYLVTHPEILVTASQKLQDPDTPATGPEHIRVAVIEFFDYQCVFCSQLAPELEKVMKAQPDVRYIFKEWPIFGSRWDASLQAAHQGLSVWKEKGPEAYVTYHNAIYATGHNEGALTESDIRAAAPHPTPLLFFRKP